MNAKEYKKPDSYQSKKTDYTICTIISSALEVLVVR